ncbi:LamG-like jellyroll fold domain-containing protein [Sneathiella sp.]|uniref:LamG-like jellyroll fold domain-containing protein n=1 Tax=Sneathiella sp. TaxID=1964365 RepID=UPI002FE0CF4B
MANTTITVSNSAQLSAALKSATGGETIVLSSGNYGDFNISNAKFSSEVTIVSANPDKMAVFDTITVQNSSNIIFDSVEVDFKPTVNTYSHDSSVMVSRSSDIIIRNSHIEGEVATQNGVGSVAGYPVGRGITIQYSTDVTLEANDVSYFHKGIVLHETNGTDIVNNSIEHLRGSHIVGTDVHNVEVDSNYFGAVTPHNYGGTGDHGDYIHFWINNGQSKDSANITITDNYFTQASGDPMMGIYIEDHWDTAAKFKNIVIDNNVMHLAHRQAILIEGADGVQVTNNTMLPSSTVPNQTPGINFNLATKNVVVTDNIISAPIAQYSKDIGILESSNNIFVQGTNSSADNYIGKLFNDGLSYIPSLDDLSTKTNLGAGANLKDVGPGSSHVKEPTPSTPKPVENDDDNGVPPVVETPSSGVDNDKPGKNPPAESSEVSDPVDTDVLLQATMDGAAKNAANSSSTVSTKGDVRFVEVDGRNAVDLNGGAIRFDANDKFLNNEAYTVSFDFKKEAASDSGYAIYFSSSFVVKIHAETISAMVATSNGTKWVTLNDIDINDTNWHQVVLTFSSESGTAMFHVDGEEVATIDGFDGAIQKGNQWHDFFVGGEFGDSFTGLIDNVSFEQGAITSKQVAEAYEASFGLSDVSEDGTTEVVDQTPEKPEQVEKPAETETGDNESHAGSGSGGTSGNDNTDIPDLRPELEIAALNQAASEFGSGVHNLGRGDEYFGQDDFTASITFALDSLDDGRQRLLWNHMNYGIQIDNDDLVIYFAEDGQQLKVYTFKDAIKDTDWHDVQLVLNDSSDTFSVYLDGQQLKVQDGVTGGVSEPKWWDVTVGGTEFQNANEFKGQIADFSILDHAVEIDSDMSVFERTAYIDSFDDMHHANLDLIGVALHEDQLNFA